jgi:hypothetical protein
MMSKLFKLLVIVFKDLSDNIFVHTLIGLIILAPISYIFWKDKYDWICIGWLILCLIEGCIRWILIPYLKETWKDVNK